MSTSWESSGVRTASRDGAIVPAPRTVVIATTDEELRRGIRGTLVQQRWTVQEAAGAAAAMACLDDLRPEVLLVDAWLPDLEVGEFAAYVSTVYPETDLIRMDGSTLPGEARSPRRHEILQVLRELGDRLGAGDGSAPKDGIESAAASTPPSPQVQQRRLPGDSSGLQESSAVGGFLPEMVGTSAAMAELGKLVRLVAPRSTTVLIEGETGTGKELVAKALHRLSARANKPFLVLNCAAIPEALLEAELFGHTRGAFTGAVRSRTGRIEAADGGTLFLDEIGEMPLALQAKMLRFLECGELQRVGDNEPTYVDVRVIAATHQPLEQRAQEQAFRLDLYHRLAVFPIEVPSLRSRMEDLPILAEHFLGFLSRGTTPKHMSAAALECLLDHHWPGNVRELMHVMERALILSDANEEIGPAEIRVRRRDRST